MSCRWGTELWDQFDNLEKHTHWGIEFVERYTKFVKERSEIEISYAKQIRNLSKKYQPKKNSREEDEYKYTSCRAFLMTLNELNDYAGQHEVIAENLTTHIICELTRYIQELKAERKSHFHDGRRAQQHIENSWKQLESSKRRFERDCKEADRAQQYFDKIDADINVTKADVEKARQQAQLKHQVAEDSKNEYLTYLQKFNKEQNEHYYNLIPHIFQVFNLTVLIDWFYIQCLQKVFTPLDFFHILLCYSLNVKFTDLHTIPHNLMSLLASPRQPPPPPPTSPSPGAVPNGPQSPQQPKEPLSHRLNEFMTSKHKMQCLRSLTRGGSGPEDCSHLPPEQRRKKLQAKINDINKELQKEVDQRDALTKMKDVYVKNPHMGDPNSVDPRLEEIGQDIDKLELESRKYEVKDHSTEHHLKSRSTDFDDDFDDEDPLPTIGTCKSLYPFEGQNEGTISMAEGELLYVIEEDKGDGWTRVRRNEDEEGYVPTSYIKVFFDTNAKGAMTYI
uniref:Formin binding protein 1a n=1 Tax=Oncorhynchus kisutch TaxID=8019 RepID=A0A8C7LI90_ONCKI